MSAPSSVTVAGHGQTAFVPSPVMHHPTLPAPGPVPVPPRITAEVRINAEVLRQTPVYAGLVKIWAERSATVPGVADPEWQRLVSYRALMEETETALAALRPHRAPDVLPPRRPMPGPSLSIELSAPRGPLRPVVHH
ncbi:hypothetical protein [Streptomyces sp. YGL11-2]|uniref:hypothetical protein n=1 Tax=Streptomyces sp. YGL11-2 TaxID=3414028 RepID=UPI003CF8FA7A